MLSELHVYNVTDFLSIFLQQIYPEGKMSQHLAKLKPGDVVEVKG